MPQQQPPDPTARGAWGGWGQLEGGRGGQRCHIPKSSSSHPDLTSGPAGHNPAQTSALIGPQCPCKYPTLLPSSPCHHRLHLQMAPPSVWTSRLFYNPHLI